MGRKLIIVRHGERVDLTFGMDWFSHSFNDDGTYIKNNLNMPDRMINRSHQPKSFHLDGPLTQVGELQGCLVGKGLRENNALRPGFQVYVSPALRSIQTAHWIMKGLDMPDKPLLIEPALFEWTGWVMGELPNFTTPDELIAHGYAIDKEYRAVSSLDDTPIPESIENYFVRTHELVVKLLAASENDILLVAHGATADPATCQLMGGPPRKEKHEMFLRLQDLPYACVCVAEQDEATGEWDLHEPGPLTMRHSSNHYFNCKKQFTGALPSKQ